MLVVKKCKFLYFIEYRG